MLEFVLKLNNWAILFILLLIGSCGNNNEQPGPTVPDANKYAVKKNGDAACPKGYNIMPYLVYQGDPTAMILQWERCPSLEMNKIMLLSYGPESSKKWKQEKVEPLNIDKDFYQYRFTNLSPGKKYCYRLQAKLTTINSFASCFVAPPPDNNQDLVIYAGGDTRSNPPILEKSFKAILNDLKKSHYSSPTLFLHVGDWIDNGNKEQNWYQEFFAVDFPGIPLFLSQIPILGVRGNHDGNTELFKKYYPYNYASKEGIYYSQKFGPVEIIAIDQYVPLSEDSEQYRWLEKTLAQSKQKFKIAFFHAPLWSAGGHINEKEILQAQNELHPLFIKYGVKLVLSGHNHYYSRSLVEGIHYLTVGTMGAPLMEPKEAFNQQKYFKGFHFCKISYFGGLWSNKIKIEIKDLDGKLIEEFSFSL